jgi:hypothetical protein
VKVEDGTNCPQIYNNESADARVPIRHPPDLTTEKVALCNYCMNPRGLLTFPIGFVILGSVSSKGDRGEGAHLLYQLAITGDQERGVDGF